MSMESSKQEYCSRLPFPFPGDLPNPVIEPGSPVLQADSLPFEPPGKPNYIDGLGCLHVSAIVTSAAINTGVHAAFQIMVFSRYKPRSGAGSSGSSFVF